MPIAKMISSAMGGVSAEIDSDAFWVQHRATFDMHNLFESKYNHAASSFVIIARAISVSKRTTRKLNADDRVKHNKLFNIPHRVDTVWIMRNYCFRKM